MKMLFSQKKIYKYSGRNIDDIKNANIPSSYEHRKDYDAGKVQEMPILGDR